MQEFTYEGVDRHGKRITGKMQAPDEKKARHVLKEQGIFASAMKSAAPAAAAEETKPKGVLFKTPVKVKHLTLFTRQLSTLQDAGLPIVRSLRILEEQTPHTYVLRDILADVAASVESGSSLSDAFSRHPKVFTKLYVNMVKAGEIGGVLDTILQRLAEFLERSERLKRRVIGAMAYPVIVLTMAFLILTGLLMFIVPKFQKMFLEIGQNLPLPTRILLGVSDLVQQFWFIILFMPLFIFIGFRLLRRNERGRYAIDFVLLKAPLIGDLLNKSVVARFTRTLGTLISSGVPILEAITIVRNAVGNEVVARALIKVHDSVREGETIAGPLKEARVCDLMVVHMIDIGEETGDLDKMLLKIADTYDEEVQIAIETLLSLIEPLMIVVMAVVIGGIVLSIFLPMVSLITSLTDKK